MLRPIDNVALTPEERRKAAYRYIADVLEEAMGRPSCHPAYGNSYVVEEIHRFVRTVRAAGEVAVMSTEEDESPRLTLPAVQTMASAKVNGSNGAH